MQYAFLSVNFFLSAITRAVFIAISLAVAISNSAVAVDCAKLGTCRSPLDVPRNAKAVFVEFASSPFPYDGMVPDTDQTFLNVYFGKRRGHYTRSGRILWQDTIYSDRRVLLHIPPNFDFRRPAVMVVFFHGHGALLSRDIRDRQLVAAQVAASRANAVLVAPQFAVNASDSSAGKFWEPGGFSNFVAEAGQKLAALQGNPESAQAFARMPVVLVAYSGGYLPAAWSLSVGGATDRLRGVVLLDALYGELDKFADWIAQNPQKFLVAAYTESSEWRRQALQSKLAAKKVTFEESLQQNKWTHGVTFLPTTAEAKHNDFVTQAWVDYPIRDLLFRLDELRR